MSQTAKQAFAEGQYPEALKLDTQRIMDVFTGADGGGDFVRFRFQMEAFAAKAATEDASFQLLRVVRQFANLIDAVTEAPRG